MEEQRELLVACVPNGANLNDKGFTDGHWLEGRLSGRFTRGWRHSEQAIRLLGLLGFMLGSNDP